MVLSSEEFKAKIGDFPNLIYDMAKNSIPYLRTDPSINTLPYNSSLVQTRSLLGVSIGIVVEARWPHG